MNLERKHVGKIAQNNIFETKSMFSVTGAEKQWKRFNLYPHFVGHRTREVILVEHMCTLSYTLETNKNTLANHRNTSAYYFSRFHSIFTSCKFRISSVWFHFPISVIVVHFVQLNSLSSYGSNCYKAFDTISWHQNKPTENSVPRAPSTVSALKNESFALISNVY